MAEETKIEWCDATFNPWIGCTEVSTESAGGGGCDNCYARTLDARHRWGDATHWGAGVPRMRTSATYWRQPLTWNRKAAASGTRPRVFCASLADVFDNEVNPTWRSDLIGLVYDTPNLDWLWLTKRIGNVPRLMEECTEPGKEWVLPPNVWLGITVVNQPEADRDIPKLLAIPARVRFLSCEPLLGAIDLPQAHRTKEALPNWPNPTRVDWVISGGESGGKARPSHPDWHRSLRDQCADAGVPFLFKQWGEWTPYVDRDREDPDWRAEYTLIDRKPEHYEILNLAGGRGFHGDRVHMMKRIGKKAAGRMLDGTTHDGFPA